MNVDEIPSIRIGDVYRSSRSRSGRCWRVVGLDLDRRTAHLSPIGPDVRDARSSTTGKWQGGVRSMPSVSWGVLAERWERVDE